MAKYSLVVLLACCLISFCQSNSTGRVVGGTQAKDKAFPHQVSLRRNSSHTCGGSIISRSYILTAAHCVTYDDGKGGFITYPASQYNIRVGSNNRLDGGFLVKVVKITVNENYGNFLNDVALLLLEAPLVYSDYIKAIPLATSEVPAGEPVVISGWGRVKTGGDIPVQLLWNTLEAITKTQCATKIFMYSDTLICLAHKVDNGACNGDSGGPATYEGKLVGVAGFVVGGCGSSNPDGYAKVYYHRDWIIKNSDL